MSSCSGWILFAVVLLTAAPVSLAQVPPTQNPAVEAVEEVVVTGSRIRRNPLDQAVAIMDISAADLNRSGLSNLGEALRRLPITGSAITSTFNVPGNAGFPQDGSGIGAGAAQVSIRNVGAKRTLVLVDGRRWIAGASASGVPSAVDLNTIPDNVIQRIEILQDGASAIYGSDAIGGVVNIITEQNFSGFKISAQGGSYFEDGDGEAAELSLLWGGGSDTTRFVVSASYAEEWGIDTWDRKRSAFPNPDARSCDVPNSQCSSFTPQARVIFGPNQDFLDIVLNDGVLNDGVGNIPTCDPNVSGDCLGSGDWHAWSNADRFNYNGPNFNFLKTPNERNNFYASLRHDFSDQVTLFAKASYTDRSSSTKGAPEPLCFGNACGNDILDNITISAANPFNPFGLDLSVANGNLEFIGRRPLESGRRLFDQEVDTYMYTLGLQGEFTASDRAYYWELSLGYGDNSGSQRKLNSHNAARLAIALGDPAVCAAEPDCVPFNLFGGQGADGEGSITQEMLDYVTFTQHDRSEQTLENAAFNIGGDVLDLGAGMLGFAAGYEYRDHDGKFTPDPIVARGETAGIPAGPTRGDFDVSEFYLELNVPLLRGVPGARYLEMNLAARTSDYSTVGSESTYKASGLWRPLEDLSLRASFSTGFRAPGIGELFGGAAREDFTFVDPCVDYTAVLGSSAGGRDVPQSAAVQSNCASFGVPVGLAQTNPQLAAISSGNVDLDPEKSDNWTAGVVYQPAWARDAAWTNGITASVDFYDLEIDDAIQVRDPGALLTACAETGEAFFCDNAPRTSSGQLDIVNNQLQNIGSIEASGVDVMLTYLSPSSRAGQFSLALNATYLDDYTEITDNPDGGRSRTELSGRHTDETFQRAFPELRINATLDWIRARFRSSLTLRWTDDMESDDGSKVDSVVFTDIRASYTPAALDDAMTVTVGINNVLDEDPPECFPCFGNGLSLVSHDLPGRVGYLRLTYQNQ